MGTRHKGFTLIELLVVIAILAILASILLPVFASVKQRAWTAHCVNNLKELASGFNLYKDDYSGSMPFVGSINYSKNTPLNGRWPNWVGSMGLENGGWIYPERGQLWKYTKNYNVYLCPSDKNRPCNKKITPPTKRTRRDYPLSYSMNWVLDGAKVDSIGLRTSKFMLLIHEDREKINDGIFQPMLRVDIPDTVHYDGSTIAYVDGHARWANIDVLEKENDSGCWGMKCVKPIEL